MPPKAHRPIVLAVIGSLLVALVTQAHAEGVRPKDTYEKKVLPVLQQFCYDCHGDGLDKGGLALDKESDLTALFGDLRMWDSVREHVDTHVMPPEAKPQPSLEQRATIVRWIEDEVFWVDPTRPDPGHITLRRLNRAEYNNTVRDVFKVDSRPADSFPPDDTGYGYDNIADVLTLSPLLMEKYLKAARKVAGEAVWMKGDGRLFREKSGHEFRDVSEASDKIDGDARSISKNGDIEAKFEIPASGIWRADLKVSANQAGSENAKLAVLVDGTELRQFEVKADVASAKGDKWERLRFDVPMKSGTRAITIRFLNDYYDEKAPDPRRRDRNLLVGELGFQGTFKFRVPEHSRLLDWLSDGKKLAPATLTLRGGDFDAGPSGVAIDSDSICFFSNGHVQRSIEIPEDGTYTLRMNVGADQAGPEKAKLRVTLGDVTLAAAEDITVKGSGEYQDWTFTTPLKKGTHLLKVEFLNDYSGGEGKDRNAFLTGVTLTEPADRAVKLDREMLQRWVRSLGTRAFRRPLPDDELVKLNAMADMVLNDGGSPLEALTLVCEALLVSPRFLFRGGVETIGAPENGTLLVDEFTLASRLSYFLWSSAPDEELLRIAGKGELRQNLRQQVTRMIGDWKGWAMTENFAGQWLQLRDVELAAPDRRRYPEFTGALAYAMKQESQLFFDHIYRGNRSVLEFLDSDYTFVNERLASYYELPTKVKGKEFQKVSLAGTPRGGLLTQGSILTLTSHPTRTSPVKRGKFLLENILGTPPPPAPQNVPAFREDRGARVQGTLRQRFEAHRANPSCASCHAFLDPMGFAFENYDAIGRWRTTDNGQPIDTTGHLLTGQKFDNAEQLRKILVAERKAEFTRCFVENLLTYALGRGLGFSDRPFVKEIVRRAGEHDYKFQEIVMAVVESVPFQRVRADAAKKVAEAK